MVKETVVFALTANKNLTEAVCKELNLPVGKIRVEHFADGEILVEPQESLRGDSVFIIQSTCNPVTERLMEVLICIDACKRASASEINVIMPYYGYARQDRKAKPRQPITSKLVADELQGVEYCLKDAQGKKTGMVVPGSEYDFDESFTEYTDGEEISAIVAFGDLFCGNGAEGLVESISRFDCPFYFVPQGNIENIEEDVLKDILSLSCEVCLSGQEAGTLHSSKDLFTAIGLLQKQTGRGVFCFTQDTGVVYRDGTEDLRVEWNTQIAVKEEDISVIILAFIISRISTVDVRNSLMFSKEYLERYLRNQRNMDAYDQDAQRQKLIHLITMK